MKQKDVVLLHIYGQPFWHANVYIVGNRLGLLSLKKAIEGALMGDTGKEETGDAVFTNDGEGYYLKVRCNDSKWSEHFWTNLLLPYTDETARDTNKGTVYPWSYPLSL